MKKPTFAFLMIMMSANTFSYEGNPSEQVRKFFSDFSTSTDKAIDNLYASNPAMQQKPQGLMVMKTQTASLANFYGKYIGYEIALEEEISPSLVRISALGKYEMHPVTWEFYFYKPKDKWMTSQAAVVDQFQNLGSKR
jgi:hypothetical protein